MNLRPSGYEITEIRPPGPLVPSRPIVSGVGVRVIGSCPSRVVQCVQRMCNARGGLAGQPEGPPGSCQGMSPPWLPDRWAPNGNHPRSQPPKPYWSRSLLTIDVWIAAQGPKQPKKQESWDSKEQGNYRKGSTSRMERGLVLVSFPLRLSESDDCGNKTEQVRPDPQAGGETETHVLQRLP